MLFLQVPVRFGDQVKEFGHFKGLKHVFTGAEPDAKIKRSFEVFTPADVLAAITQHIPDTGVHRLANAELDSWGKV